MIVHCCDIDVSLFLYIGYRTVCGCSSAPSAVGTGRVSFEFLKQFYSRFKKEKSAERNLVDSENSYGVGC